MTEKAEQGLAEAATEKAEKPQPKLQQHTSLWKTRFTSFTTGVALASVFGLLRIQEDVNQANVDLKARLAEAHNDVTVLNKRMKDMEARMALYEQDKALSADFSPQQHH